jgi:hypothetical protein
MFDDLRVWYPAKKLSGGIKFIPNDAEAHILYKGIFLCGKNISDAISDAECDTGTIKLGVIPGADMCPECQRLFKANPNFAYWKWVESAK